MPLIYRVDCRATGLSYVGQTTLTLEERWKAHVDRAGWIARHRPEEDTYFARAIRKYGVEAFEPRVIEEISEELLDQREIHWIAELGTFEKGYNSTKGGEGCRGRLCSEETREKIRRANVGQKRDPETCRKIGDIKRGVKQDPLIVEKRAAANKAAGHKRSDDVKERIRAGNLGKKRSVETRARIASVATGRKLSEDTKKKLGRPVRQLTRDGQVVAIFDTMTEAAKATGYSKGAICNNIRDRQRWPLKEAVFEYVAT